MHAQEAEAVGQDFLHRQGEKCNEKPEGAGGSFQLRRQVSQDLPTSSEQAGQRSRQLIVANVSDSDKNHAFMRRDTTPKLH